MGRGLTLPLSQRAVPPDNGTDNGLEGSGVGTLGWAARRWKPLALSVAAGGHWGLLAGSYADATEPVTLLRDRTRTTTLSWGAVPASYSPIEDAFGGV